MRDGLVMKRITLRVFTQSGPVAADVAYIIFCVTIPSCFKASIASLRKHISKALVTIVFTERLRLLSECSKLGPTTAPTVQYGSLLRGTIWWNQLQLIRCQNYKSCIILSRAWEGLEGQKGKTDPSYHQDLVTSPPLHRTLHYTIWDLIREHITSLG